MAITPALLRKHRTLVFFIVGLLLLALDRVVYPGEYSKASFLGVLLFSFTLLMLAVSLNGPASSFDFLLIKYAAAFCMATAVFNVLIVLLFAHLFHFLMSDIISFSCGLFTLGACLLVNKLPRPEDTALEEKVSGVEGAEFTRSLLVKAPLAKKIIWGLALAAGIVLAEVFGLAQHLAIFFKI